LIYKFPSLSQTFSLNPTSHKMSISTWRFTLKHTKHGQCWMHELLPLNWVPLELSYSYADQKSKIILGASLSLNPYL
jgi:hypothetical protein